MMNIEQVLLVGGGNMGRALAEGWLGRGIEANAIVVVEPDPEARASLSGRVRCVTSEGELPGTHVDAVVFAVKPAQLGAVASRYRRFRGPGTVFISVAAGRSLQFLAEQLGRTTALVRAMPNTPAAIGRSMTVLCANESVGSRQRDVATTLLASVGDVAWIDDETLMDAVTAVSGSGPAYVFLVIESLAAAGVAVGLPEDLAMRLARSTVAGAGALAASAAASPAELRRQVTSPGGTTEAALAVMMKDDRLGQLFGQAVAAAKARSQELG